MDVGGTTINSACVDRDGFINLEEWMGRACGTIPLAIRDRDQAITHVSSLLATVGDLNCDPRRGGIACVNSMADIYGVTNPHFRRNILPRLKFVRLLAGLPVSNVSSLQASAARYKETVRAKNCENLIQYTRCNSGSTASSSGMFG